MVERQEAADFSLLTEVESAALSERKGLRQRARALQALAEFAAVVGLGEDQVSIMAERIRGLETDEVKQCRRTFEHATSLIPAQVPQDDAPVEAALIKSSPVEAPLEVNADESAAPEQVATPEATFPVLGFERVQSFYGLINKKSSNEYLTAPQSPEEVDTDEVLALLELYARGSRKPSVLGDSLNKVLKCLEVGPAKAAEELGVSLGSLTVLWSNVTNKIASYLDDVMTAPEGSRAEKEEQVAPVAAPELAERIQIEELEPHEALTERFAELFDFDSAEKTAFRCLIEPNNRGELTSNKERVIEAIRTRLENELGSLVELRALFELPVERIRVTSLLGFHIKEKTIGNQPPQQLSQQLRSLTNPAERRAQIMNLHRGLAVVADFLEGKQSEQSNVVQADFEHHRPAIKQVEIVDGKAKLV